MKTAISLEHRFDRIPDGSVWSQTMFAYDFWQRYLAVFDRVNVIARVRDVETIPDDWKRSDGRNVSFATIPYYLGPEQYLLRRTKVRNAVRNAVGPADAIIMRVGSQLAGCLEPLLRKTGHPYGVEVVNDPFDVFSPGAIKHPLRPFFRWWFSRQLRRQCAGARAASYVTANALQQRYPPSPGAFSTGCSDVELNELTFADTPRNYFDINPISLVCVGSLSHFQKAPDILLKSVADCVNAGMNIRLIFVGDGKHRPELEAKALALGLESNVDFKGQLTAGKAVRDELDHADLFTLPSRTEGLPRAMIEAMARALPCIGSTVGGIPELLPPEDMVPPGDVRALANKIKEIVTDPERMNRMSARNLEKAREYDDKILRQRREEFYRCIREKTEEWITKKTP